MLVLACSERPPPPPSLADIDAMLPDGSRPPFGPRVGGAPPDMRRPDPPAECAACVLVFFDRSGCMNALWEREEGGGEV